MTYCFSFKVLIDDCTFGGTDGFDYIVEGFDKLPRSFESKLGSSIHYKAKVVSVENSKNNTKNSVQTHVDNPVHNCVCITFEQHVDNFLHLVPEKLSTGYPHCQLVPTNLGLAPAVPVHPAL